MLALRRSLPLLVALSLVLSAREARCQDDDPPPPKPRTPTAPTLEFRAQRVIKAGGALRQVSLSADGKLMAANEWPPTDGLWGWVWDVRTGEAVARFGFEGVSLGETRLSPDGRTVAFTRDLYFARFPHTRTPKTAEKMRGPSNNGPFGGFGKPAQKAANP